jgi:hypothetical protein
MTDPDRLVPEDPFEKNRGSGSLVNQMIRGKLRDEPDARADGTQQEDGQDKGQVPYRRTLGKQESCHGRGCGGHGAQEIGVPPLRVVPGQHHAPCVGQQGQADGKHHEKALLRKK